MAEAWRYLVCRYGSEIDSPTPIQLREAIEELYHENLPSMTEGNYDEHGAGSLRYGFDDGPMFVIEVTRHGKVTFEEWADQDYVCELCPARVMRGVSEKVALQLWLWLAQGEIDPLRLQPFETLS